MQRNPQPTPTQSFEYEDGVQIKPNFGLLSAKDDPGKYETFKDRVELYFDVVPDSGDRRKTAIFLSAIDIETYKLIKDLVQPRKPGDMSVADLFLALDRHFHVKVSSLVLRLQFRKIHQQKEEKIKEFMSRLREGAKLCEFGGFLKDDLPEVAKLRKLAMEDQILEQFVKGLFDKAVQQQLIKMDPGTLAVAFDKAYAMELATVAKGNVPGEKAKPVQNRGQAQGVEKGRGRQGKQKEESGGTAKKCYRCGNGPHDLNDCPGRSVICRKCNCVGHFDRWCRNAKVQVNAAVSKTVVFKM